MSSKTKPKAKPTSSNTNSKAPKSLVDYKKLVKLDEELTLATQELKNLQRSEIDKHTQSIRKERLKYKHDVYESDEFFDLSGCEAYIRAYGGKEELIRAYFYYSWYNDSDRVEITYTNIGSGKFKLIDHINIYNGSVIDKNKEFFNVHQQGFTNKPAQEAYYNNNKTTIHEFTIKDPIDVGQSGSNDVLFDLETVYDETIAKIQNVANIPNGRFIQLGSSQDENSYFIKFLTHTLQKSKTIKNVIAYIAPDNDRYLLKLDDQGEISEQWECERDDISWSTTIDSSIKNNFNTYLKEGSTDEKVREIKQYIQENQLEAQKAKSEQEIKQPELVTSEDGNVIAYQEETLQGNKASKRKLTASQIKERVEILNRKDKENPSKLLAMLEMMGLNKAFIIGAIAANTDIANNDLDISIMAVMGAAFTVIFRKSSLPSFITGSSESNSNSALQYERPNAQQAITPENISRGGQTTQDKIHKRQYTQYNITDKKLIDIATKEAIYLAPGTTMTVQADQEVTLYNNIEGKKDQKLSKSHIKSETTKQGKQITVNKPALLLRDSIKQPLEKNITFKGHIYYSQKNTFKNFNFN